MKNEKGISLLALIITIIVIIILAMVVIGTSLNTPEMANFAKFSSDMSRMNEVVNHAYMEKYTQLAVTGQIVEKEKIYNWVATGELETPEETDVVITAGNNLKIGNLPVYSGVWKVESTTGIVKLVPGYLYNGKVYSTVNDLSNGGTEGGITTPTDPEPPVGPTTPTEPEEPVGPTTPTEPEEPVSPFPEGEVAGYSEAGTEQDPYQIWSAEDMIYFAKESTDASGKYYKLMKDIDLTDDKSYISSANKSQSIMRTQAFSGNFDGNNKVLKNLLINDSTSQNVGLFASVKNTGVVQNLTLENCNVTGTKSVGAICGNSVGTIRNCTVKGAVNGSSTVTTDGTGGIVGNAGTNSLIEGCTNEATVTGKSATGGIVGNSKGNIKACGNKAIISGTTGVGGIVGSKNDSEISNCYNNGAITASGNIVGGIVGLSSNSIINASYNTASVTTTTDIAGGICGQQRNSGTEGIKNTYNTGRISSKQIAGGITGFSVGNSATTPKIIKCSYNIGEVSATNGIGGIVSLAQYCLPSNTVYKQGTAAQGIGNGTDKSGVVAAWDDTQFKSNLLESDFNQINGTTVWKRDTENINNGYPILSWQ